MTSMPASRSVRAMIFAPRSWPSRPGFATTTRILRLMRASVSGANAPLRRLARGFSGPGGGVRAADRPGGRPMHRPPFRTLTSVSLLALALAAGCGGGSSGSSGSSSVGGVGQPGGETGPAAPASSQQGTVAAANLFSNNCSGCHGDAGQGGVGPNLQTLDDAGDLQTVENQVRNGGGGMPAFEDKLSDDDIEQVASYVVDTIHQGG